MKKVIALLVALILCLSLTGCVLNLSKGETVVSSDFLQQTQTEKEPEGESGTEPQKVLTANRESEIFGGDMVLAANTALAIRISINPEFVVFVDMYGAVCAVQCLNEDAKPLLAAAEVTGRTIEEGMAALLTAAYDQGFLKADTAKIQMEPSVHNGLSWTEALDAALTRIVTDFEAEKSLKIDLTVIPPEITETSGSFGQQGDAVTTKEQTDVLSGERVTMYYDEMGRVVKSITQRKDGAVEECIRNPETGRIIRVLLVYPDGGYVEHFYEGSSHPVRRVEMSANGDYDETTYYPNGKRATAYVKNADGREMNVQYYENGKDKYILETDPDGTVHEHFYNEGSVIALSVTKKPDGSSSETTYYPSGMQARCVTREADGFYSETEWYDRVGGSVTENGDQIFANASGNLKRSVMEGDGMYVEQHYREDGSRSYYYTEDSEGSQEITSDVNGAQNIKNRYVEGDVAYYEEHRDAAGNVIYRKEVLRDGTVSEWPSDGK